MEWYYFWLTSRIPLKSSSYFQSDTGNTVEVKSKIKFCVHKKGMKKKNTVEK